MPLSLLFALFACLYFFRLQFLIFIDLVGLGHEIFFSTAKLKLFPISSYGACVNVECSCWYVNT